MNQRDALVSISTIFEASEGELSNGGFELSKNQYTLILAILKSALKNSDEKQNVQN